MGLSNTSNLLFTYGITTLSGRDKNHAGYGHSNGCFLVAPTSDSAVTRSACADTGRWLGENSAPAVTIVDTPGFGNGDAVEEEEMAERLVEYLRDEIK